MDPDGFTERATAFFPKAKDWPPPERQPTITPEDMVKPDTKKAPPLSKNN